MAIIAASVQMPSADALDDVKYIDPTINPAALQSRNGVTVIDSTYFAATPYTLGDGTPAGSWYLVRGSFSVTETIKIDGNVHLILEDHCDMKVEGSYEDAPRWGYAGINVPASNSLTIYAQSTGAVMGILNVKTMTTTIKLDNHGAAIGGNGGGDVSVGSITINGGSIDAWCVGNMGAGIGGGNGGNNGTVTINGGKVHAQSGYYYTNPPYATNIGAYGAGIGGGSGGNAGTITINGGQVTARGAPYAAGIGGGESGNGGNITINGGVVEASTIGVLSKGGSGIGSGGGSNLNGGIITITGGKVTATGSGDGPGIGGAGWDPNAGTITISGGDVTATGGPWSAGIGTGYRPAGGNILIYGETTVVKAYGGSNTNQDIGNGGNPITTPCNVFVAVLNGNLTTGGRTTYNNVLFTADPASTDPVTAALPAPFSATKELFKGLGRHADGESVLLSVSTTFGAGDIVQFGLHDYYDVNPIPKTGAELKTPNMSVDFVMTMEDIAITIVGNGSVSVGDGTISFGTLNANGTISVPSKLVTAVLRATPAPGSTFVGWNGDASGNALVFNLPMAPGRNVTATFDSGSLPNHFISAFADGSTTITPSGTISVPRGGSVTFVFEAKDGHRITGVMIDGVPLSRTEIDRGFYTFTDVRANHVIQVTGRDDRIDITLRIDIKSGHGFAEYSINGGPLTKYTEVVILPDNSNVNVVAHPDDGYRFKEWREGGKIISEESVSFTNITGSVYLELYFVVHSDDVGIQAFSLLWWILVALGILILAGFLLWFLLYHRRTYDVIKVARDVNIVGKDRVRRKRSYTFAIEGGPPGAVSYKVGEDGEWKMLIPNEKGEFTIPKGEITEDVTIEQR